MACDDRNISSGRECMKHFGHSLHRISIAECVVLIYATLVVVSAGCTLAHTLLSE